MDTYFLRGRPDLDRALQEAARRLSRLLTVSDIAVEIEAILKSTLAIDAVIVLTDRSEARALPEQTNEAAWAIPQRRDGAALGATMTRLEFGTYRTLGTPVRGWVSLGRGTEDRNHSSWRS